MTTPLTLDGLIDVLTQLRARQPDLAEAVVEVAYDPGHQTIGGRTATPVVAAQAGFDWDMGRVFVATEKALGIPEDALRQRQHYLEEAIMGVRLAVRPRTGPSVLSEADQLARVQSTLEQLQRHLKALAP